MNEESRPKAAPETPAKRTETSVPLTGVRRGARNADQWWWAAATSAVEWLCRSRSTWTVDDLRDLGVPEADAACRWGSLLAACWRSGLIEPVGASVSARDGRLVRVWAGAAR